MGGPYLRNSGVHMADALFDTTVFIDYRRGDNGARALIQLVLDGAKSASFSALTVAELWQGDMKDRQEELEYAALFAVMEEAPLRSQDAKEAGCKIRKYTDNQKAQYFADALIASTAECRNEPLFTRNGKHMSLFHPNVQTY